LFNQQSNEATRFLLSCHYLDTVQHHIKSFIRLSVLIISQLKYPPVSQARGTKDFHNQKVKPKHQLLIILQVLIPRNHLLQTLLISKILLLKIVGLELLYEMAYVIVLALNKGSIRSFRRINFVSADAMVTNNFLNE